MRRATLAVLAGGVGSRMGRPKGELCVAGRPILQYLLERWQWPGSTILVTAPGREHPLGHGLFDREVHDAARGEGPLRGIVTALENAGDAEIVVIATCDMPLLTRAMMESLIHAMQRDVSLVGAMMRRGDVVEPFPISLRPSVIGVLRERLVRGERSVQSLLRIAGFACIAGPDDEALWTNLNNADDLARFNDAQARDGA